MGDWQKSANRRRDARQGGDRLSEDIQGKPRSKARRSKIRKPWGIASRIKPERFERFHRSVFGNNEWRYTQWYTTEKSRDQAFDTLSRKCNLFEYKKVER